MRSFIINFFGCTECAENFKKETKTFTEDPASVVRSNDDAILYLWRIHNSVNKRLHGDVTEDPQHPKIQFPSAQMCRTCRTGGDWNTTNVLAFLKDVYSYAKIAKDSEILLKKNSFNNVKDTARRREVELERNQNIPEKQSAHDYFVIPSDTNFQSFNKRRIDPQVFESSTYLGLNGFDVCISVLCYCACCFLILLIYLKIVVRYRFKNFCAA